MPRTFTPLTLCTPVPEDGMWFVCNIEGAAVRKLRIVLNNELPKHSVVDSFVIDDSSDNLYASIVFKEDVAREAKFAFAKQLVANMRELDSADFAPCAIDVKSVMAHASPRKAYGS